MSFYFAGFLICALSSVHVVRAPPPPGVISQGMLVLTYKDMESSEFPLSTGCTGEIETNSGGGPATGTFITVHTRSSPTGLDMEFLNKKINPQSEQALKNVYDKYFKDFVSDYTARLFVQGYKDIVVKPHTIVFNRDKLVLTLPVQKDPSTTKTKHLLSNIV